MALTPQSMQRGHQAILDQYPNMIVKQTCKGWLQELLLGCEAAQEYIISGVDSPQQMAMYALEEPSFFNRCCW